MLRKLRNIDFMNQDIQQILSHPTFTFTSFHLRNASRKYFITLKMFTKTISNLNYLINANTYNTRN